MSKNPIEAQWLEIEREHFACCCDDLRELQRGTFFAGAMAAMQAIASWSPDRPRSFTLNTGRMAAVADELASEFNVGQATADIAEAQDMVRH